MSCCQSEPGGMSSQSTQTVRFWLLRWSSSAWTNSASVREYEMKTSATASSAFRGLLRVVGRRLRRVRLLVHHLAQVRLDVLGDQRLDLGGEPGERRPVVVEAPVEP